MKNCPFCAEEIQDAAIKCRHCGEFLADRPPPAKWHTKTSVLIIAFLTVGPFALPLVWFNPRYSMAKKLVISAVIIVLSFTLYSMFLNSLRSLTEYYGVVFNGL